MSDQFNSGLMDDNGFEKVQHADISASTFSGSPTGAPTGVDDLMSSPNVPSGETAPVLTPAPVAPSSFQISTGTMGGPSPGSSPLAEQSAPPAVKGPQKVEEGDKKSSGGCCVFIQNIDPRVLDLIYWRDIKKSGVVFASMLILLLSLALFSVLSVAAYLSLVLLTITLTFRLYKNVLAAVQKTGDGHPFKEYLDMELSMNDTKVRRSAEELIQFSQSSLNTLKRLFLIEDIVDSMKFGLLLWLLTYIGAWFNGMTLIILCVVGVFTLPKVYEVYKVQIDEAMALLKNKLQLIIKQVQEKLPLPGKKKQA